MPILVGLFELYDLPESQRGETIMGIVNNPGKAETIFSIFVPLIERFVYGFAAVIRWGFGKVTRDNIL